MDPGRYYHQQLIRKTPATTHEPPHEVFGPTLRIDGVDASAGELSEFFRANTVGDADQSETNVSAAVSAVFETDSPWTFHIGLGRAVRTATSLERYSDRFPSTKFQLAAEFMGNPQLDPEESLEFNAGARGSFGDFLLELDLFWSLGIYRPIRPRRSS